MTFTDNDFERQQVQLQELKDELSRLDDRFKAQLKAGNIAPEELTQIDLASVPAEVRKALEAAQDAARHAGAARAAQSAPASVSSTGRAPGAGRRGVVRM